MCVSVCVCVYFFNYYFNVCTLFVIVVVVVVVVVALLFCLSFTSTSTRCILSSRASHLGKMKNSRQISRMMHAVLDLPRGPLIKNEIEDIL